MKTNGNDPINTVDQEYSNANDYRKSRALTNGLTKREHFAAMMMQGLLAQYGGEMVQLKSTDTEGYAQLAVIMTDALINELNK